LGELRSDNFHRLNLYVRFINLKIIRRFALCGVLKIVIKIFSILKQHYVALQYFVENNKLYLK